MKFLLIRCSSEQLKPNRQDYLFSPSVYPPLGLEYIAAALEQENHNVEIIDLYKQNISDTQLKKLVTSSDSIGLHVCTDTYSYASQLSAQIKEMDSDIPILIGGPHCTFFKKNALSDIPTADICIVGEGELIIHEIVKYMKGKKELKKISGIFYREHNNIKNGKPLQIIQDLDFPYFPARHLVDKYEYGDFPGGYAFNKRFTSMETSRGCPFRCRFCARYGNVVEGFGFRQRSAEHVVKEIQEIDKKYGSVMIIDDNFLADTKRANKIMDQLIEMNTRIELLIMGARVDTAERKLYSKMKKANVKLVGFGIESGDQNILDGYNKKITLNQTRTAVHLAKEMGFMTFASFIFGSPIETEQSIENTIKFASSLPLDIAAFGCLQYQMGSQLWVEAVQEGKISENEFMVPADTRRNLGSFTTEELKTYMWKAFRRFYFRPSYLLRQLYKAYMWKDIGLIKNGPKFLNSLLL